MGRRTGTTLRSPPTVTNLLFGLVVRMRCNNGWRQIINKETTSRYEEEEFTNLFLSLIGELIIFFFLLILLKV